MKVTLLTPGGGRKKAFQICEKLVQRQTIWGKMDIEWIVIDDDKNSPLECTLGQKHIFGDLQWRPGINTLRYNLDAGLREATGDVIFILENDDHYSSRYCEVMLSILEHAELGGYADVVYYNIAAKGFHEMKNRAHASTACTAFRKSYVPWFERALHGGEQYFDLSLWSQAQRGKHNYILFSGPNLSVGMKGLPGRSGIGYGHTHSHEFTPDQNFIKLRELVGIEDAKMYTDLVKDTK